MQIRDELIEARNKPEGNLEICNSARMNSRVQRFQKILGELYLVIKLLQTRGYSLAECRDDLEVLVKTVAEHRDDADSLLYQFKIESKYIAPLESIFQHPGLRLRLGRSKY